MKNNNDTKLDRLWHAVEHELESTPIPGESLEDQRDAFLTECLNKPSPRVLFPSRLTGLAAALLMVLAGTVYFSSIPNDIAYTVDQQKPSTVTGEWLQSTNAKKVSIDFETGTNVLLMGSSEARILESNSDEIRLDLSRGALIAKVIGDGRASTVIQAGPYTATVLGTKFGVSWNPEGNQLTVQVESGRVRISGGHFKQSGSVLDAGESLSTDGETTKIWSGSLRPWDEMGKPVIDNPSTIVPLPEDQVSDAHRVDGNEPSIPWEDVLGETEEAADPDSQSISAVSFKEQLGSWRRLFDGGRFGSAVQEVERLGLERFLRNGTLTDLWDLSNAARYTHKGIVARKALERIRKSHPKTQKARAATYLLGRVCLEIDHNPASARTWFERYLAESPNGRFAEEALGHLLDACRSSGDLTSAKRIAHQYLEEYPSGIHAAAARSLVE